MSVSSKQSIFFWVFPVTKPQEKKKSTLCPSPREQNFYQPRIRTLSTWDPSSHPDLGMLEKPGQESECTEWMVARAIWGSAGLSWFLLKGLLLSQLEVSSERRLSLEPQGEQACRVWELCCGFFRLPFSCWVQIFGFNIYPLIKKRIKNEPPKGWSHQGKKITHH